MFFHAEHRFIERQLPVGEHALRQRAASSATTTSKQMAHPDYIVAPEARGDLPMLEPVYPLTAGLSGKILLKAARQALERVPRPARVAGRRLAQGSAAGPISRRR